VKIGELLVVLGAMHLMNFVIFRRIRRRPAAAATGPVRRGPQPTRALRLGPPLDTPPRDPQDVH
jgi:hypothetical protein